MQFLNCKFYPQCRKKSKKKMQMKKSEKPLDRSGGNMV